MTDKDLTAPEAVERFHASEFSSDMIPASRGDYVRYSDYAALSAERRTLIQALKAGGEIQRIAIARAEAAEAKLKEAVAALNQYRLAAAGYVSVQSARDKADAFLADIEGDKP